MGSIAKFNLSCLVKIDGTDFHHLSVQCSTNLTYFIRNSSMIRHFQCSACFSNIKSIVLTSVNFSIFTLTQQEELMRWHPSGVKRTRIRVITVNFSDFLIKGKEIKSELAGNSSYPCSN